LNHGDIPKTGGPKEQLSQNDLDNKELFEWAKQEKMDLNEINRAIYKQRNGKNNSQNNKEQDDNRLKNFVEFKNDSNNSNNSNKSTNPNNDIISQDNSNNKYSESPETNDKQNLKKNAAESNTISNRNNFISSNRIKNEDYNQANLKELQNEGAKRESINNNNINTSANSKSKNYEKYDSIARANPIDFSNQKVETDSSNRQSISGSNAKLGDVNKIFLNKQNSSVAQDAVDNNRFSFLHMDVDAKKIQSRRVASISNKVINRQDQNFTNKNESDFDTTRNKRDFRSNYINNNNFNSKNTIKDISHEKEQQITNIKESLSSSAATMNVVFNPNTHSNTERINRDNKASYEIRSTINRNRSHEKRFAKVNDSLYDFDPSVEEYNNIDNPFHQISKVNKSLVPESSNSNNKYEDINSCDYNQQAENVNLHSFNNKNSVHKLNIDAEVRMLALTPKPEEISSHNQYSLNKSVSISNDYYKQRFSNFNKNITPEKNIKTDNFKISNISDKSINNNDLRNNYYQNAYQQQMHHHHHQQQQNNTNNAPFNNKNYGLYYNQNQLQNQIQQPLQQYKEIPTILGAGYKFTYDKYLDSANKPFKKATELINKIEHKEQNKTKDDIDKMLQDLKSPAVAKSNPRGITPVKTNNKMTNNNDNKTGNDDLFKKLSNEKLEKFISPPSKKDSDIVSEKNNKLQEDSLEAKKVENSLMQLSSEKLSSPEKTKKAYSNLQTGMLKNFDITSYKNLPNFEIPLEYDSPEKRSKLKEYFKGIVKSSLSDIKKDDINTTLKKLELVLYYFTNMKDN